MKLLYYIDGANLRITVEMKMVCIELMVLETVNVKINTHGMDSQVVLQIVQQLTNVHLNNSNSNTIFMVK